MRSEGWYSGDTRCHFLTPHAALLEAAAEDVAVVNLLAKDCVLASKGQREHRTFSNILAFSGQRPALEMPGHVVVVNTTNWHPTLGRLLLLNCHRPVYPLTFGGPAGEDDWTLADWCDQCHRKGGLVIGDDFFGHFPDSQYGELLADLILGKVDALQVSEFPRPDRGAHFHNSCAWALAEWLGSPKPPPLAEWYDLLSSGLHVPLVAGSGKESNLGWLGSARTYAQLEDGQEFSHESWIEAVRAGRTFVSTGPFLSLSVEGQGPGGLLELPSSGSRIRVRAEARNYRPIHRLEVLLGGAVVAEAEGTGSPASAVIETEVAVPMAPLSEWLAARCWGKDDDAPQGWTAAHTSGVYVQVEGKPTRPYRDIVDCYTRELDKTLAWVAHAARCDDKHRERLANIFRSAKEELVKRFTV